MKIVADCRCYYIAPELREQGTTLLTVRGA